VVAFSEPLTGHGGDDGPGEGSNDEIVTYRVGWPLSVIVWDAEAKRRRVVQMRWGFPHPKDWRRPQPIHARAETVEAIEPFRKAFQAGQRGIVVFRTFNEGEEVLKPASYRSPLAREHRAKPNCKHGEKYAQGHLWFCLHSHAG
jgi:hypothetical protein